MKSTIALSLLLIVLVSCQESQTDVPAVIDNISYPAEIQKIFSAHGDLNTWNKYQAMSYEIDKEEVNEKQFIDLNDRRERIEAENVSMGFDGTNFWMEADSTFKGNPIFYKNLMFYFYAMPFVLADPGIIYTSAEPLVYDGQSYPGFRISYQSDIGVSPEDEYFLHYNPETFKMEWLGYTVTYFSKEKSTAIKWIRYDDWKDINGLQLPNSLAWYTLEEDKPVELRNRLNFKNVVLSENPHPKSVFEKTANAEIVTE